MKHPYCIRLSDTDAAGRIYFAAAMDIAHASFEELMASIGFDLGSMVASSPFIFPVVRVEADYKAPLALGDRVDVVSTVASIGGKSVTFRHELHSPASGTCITVSMTHATVSRRTGRAIALPSRLRKALRSVS